MLSGLTIDGVDKTEEIKQFAEFIGLTSLVPARCSAFLISQIYCEAEILGELAPERVIREIRSLENPEQQSCTKPATQFGRPHLKGLWHKHYRISGISSIATNVMRALNQYGTPQFTESVKQVQESGEERYFEKEDIDRLVQEIVVTNYEKRLDDQRITGEWIVYAIYEGKNYYLCLGKHTMSDEELRQQIDLTCVPEFPFLKDILKPIN